MKKLALRKETLQHLNAESLEAEGAGIRTLELACNLTTRPSLFFCYTQQINCPTRFKISACISCLPL